MTIHLHTLALPPPTYTSFFSGWQQATGYTCNSWILQVLAGGPIYPNVGDIASFTISGSFSGSPVTVQHTMSSSDITALQALIPGGIGTTPIADDLIAQINASAAGLAGITAGYTVTVSSGFQLTQRYYGRIFLNFNSANVGDITVYGSYAINGPNTVASTYVQPNGTGVRNGVDVNNRPLNYQAATSKVSGFGAGPSGTVQQSLITGDGTMSWCYAPNFLPVI